MVYVVAKNKIQDFSIKKVIPKNEDKNLQSSLKFFLISLQIFGLLPVKNVTKSFTELKFKWNSLIVCCTFVMISMTLFAVCTWFYTWSDYGYVFADLVIYFFYTGSGLTLILYLRLATRWSGLMKSWSKMDHIMNKNYGYPPNLDKRLRICSAIFLSLSVVDFLLSQFNHYTNMVNKLDDGYDYKKFFNETFPQLYLAIPVNIFTATYCAFLSFHATLVQAFNDLFIILLSITLAQRFQQITQKLEEHFTKFQVKSREFWIEIREDYDRLSMLCKELDDHISFIVLLSYTTNIFLLLVQLYQSLELDSGVIGKIYFAFSFIHLIFRIVCVSLYSAWVNDESIEPASILHCVSSSCYNIEVKRLLWQISFDNVALTGCKMFKITRGIILSIAGAIVTYELVLIQFNSATTDKEKIK